MSISMCLCVNTDIDILGLYIIISLKVTTIKCLYLFFPKFTKHMYTHKQNEELQLFNLLYLGSCRIRAEIQL